VGNHIKALGGKKLERPSQEYKNRAESFKEDYVPKRAVLPMIMMSLEMKNERILSLYYHT
jgi:hypothetical protein